MRRLLLIGLLAAGSIPAFAAHRVSVSQLEQTLSAAAARHHADADVAHQLGDIELSERLTDATLLGLVKKLALQPQTTLALQLLADESAVLDPPKDELPATAPPDAETQQRILSSARGYVVETIPRLPNLFATRSTMRFDDSVQVVRQGEWPIRAGFHPVGSSSRTVTVRDGHEVADSVQDVAAKGEQTLGLYSFGEFGPVLARTLTDLAAGKIEFSHWENSPLGVVAVYHYSVPKNESHYQVHFCCMVDREFVGQTGSQNRDRPGYHIGAVNQMNISGPKAFDVTPAYRGTLAIEPVSGAIVRMTLDAELDPQDPITRATTVVEYGRVVIGNAAFVCPMRSVAISAQPLGPSATGTPTGGPVVSINETTFAQYHRLGSTARMIADGSVPQSGKPSDAPDPQWIASSPTQPPIHANGNPQPAGDAGSATPPVEAKAEAVPPPAPAATPAQPAEPVVPEMSMSDAKGIPDVPAGALPPQDTGFSLKVTTRLVDVGVVALDKRGRPVSDLRADDFEIYDNGKKQEIRSFTPPASEPPAAPVASPATEPDREYSNRASDLASDGPAAAPAASGGTILLLDESHIAWNDLNYARGQMLKFLATLPAGQRVGLYSMNGLGFHVLVEVTSDYAAVAARLKAFLPSAQSVNEAQEEEQRNRQQFATVHNVADLNSVNGNHADVPDADQPVDPQLLTMGSNPARASLVILAQVARHLAAIPGHKNLVWVSSDNVLADWQDQAVGIDKSPKMIESYAVRAQEAMNEAHAAVYPFDVSQLEAGGITADLQHSNVQLDQAAQENATTAASAGGPAASSPASNRDTGTGRISAQMSQDLHPIQGPVREVAAGTGGRTIRRAGDLAAALDGIVEDGRGRYQLSFSPQGEADDSYHAITVKLTGRRGAAIRYRTGYLFAKEPMTLKDRFRQAVWQPTDSSEIGVKVRVTPSGAGSLIRVSIAASDVGMEQGGGRWMDKLDIFFIQRDDAGIRAQVDGQTLGLRLKPATYQNVLSGGIPFEREVEIRPGMASVRVLVVDENSGRMGSVTIPSSTLRAAR